MDDKKIIVISGPSGVGKTTLYKKILEAHPNELGFSISATTRAKRDGEVDGQDYHFIAEDEFQQLIASGEFIEWEQVFTNYYGTLKSEIYRIWEENKHCVLDIDVRGGLRIQKMFGDKAFLVFIAPPCMDTLESRLRLRGANDEHSLQTRLANANDEMSQKGCYNIVLENDDFDHTLQKLTTIIEEQIK